MNKAYLLSFIFVAVLSSAFALTGNTTTDYTQGDFTNDGGLGTAGNHQIYWVITEQPTQIKGYYDGKFAYVGFFPLQDNYTYFAPFGNGTFIYHCNPDSVDLGKSVICTGTLVDENGQAINNAHIEWYLYNNSDILFGDGVFVFLGNGAYKFTVDIPETNNYTTGDYYFKFIAVGFGADYIFPLYINSTFTQDDVLSIFAMIMIILSIVTVIFGYWKKFMGFVVFGAFAMILIAMLMLEEQQLFGATVSNVFAVIFSLLGFFFLLSMFLQKWKEGKIDKEQKRRIVDTEEDEDSE